MNPSFSLGGKFTEKNIKEISESAQLLCLLATWEDLAPSGVEGGQELGFDQWKHYLLTYSGKILPHLDSPRNANSLEKSRTLCAVITLDACSEAQFVINAMCFEHKEKLHMFSILLDAPPSILNS
jgi:hypothetical protein